jgi:hypothetical protein
MQGLVGPTLAPTQDEKQRIWHGSDASQDMTTLPQQKLSFKLTIFVAQLTTPIVS